MNHFSKIVIEMETKTPADGATQEQLDAVTDEAIKSMVHEAIVDTIGKEFDDETGSLKYTIKVVRNEII